MSAGQDAVVIEPIDGIGELGVGDPLGRLIAGAAPALAGEEIVCVVHKAVAKIEGRLVRLADVTPGPQARHLAAEVAKDPALVELILAESRRVVRARPGVLITETHHGWVCANAGIDASNVPGDDTVALLPVDADLSARRLRDELEEACGVRPAVLIADSFGRAWRVGQADVAIGAAGLTPIDDWVGRPDGHCRELAATQIALADEIAAAADLARTKTSRTPAVRIRGLGRHVIGPDGPGAAALRRDPASDLFR